MPPPGQDVFLHADPTPNTSGAWGVLAAVELGTDAAGLTSAQAFLAGQHALVVGVTATASLLAPDANGYVRYIPNETSIGGHAMHVAGWVPNSDLPVGAPSGSGGGYFVVKNSWGERSGDCGYFYIPYDYILNYGHTLTTVAVD